MTNPINDLIDLCLATNVLFQDDESFRGAHLVNLYTLSQKTKGLSNLLDIIVSIQLRSDEVENKLSNVTDIEFIDYIGLLDVLGVLYENYY